jgi:hypothetical protein
MSRWHVLLADALLLVCAAPTLAREHHCPSTGRTRGACPGYVRDHIRALACGGPDAVGNLQWQSVEDARAKDRWERKGRSRP